MTFQKRVLALLAGVPPGRVTTYKALGELLGIKGYQAIGRALACNPHAPDVPCHRVVTVQGALGGYGGSKGADALARKRQLLLGEGVRFTDEDHVDPGSIMTSQEIHERLSLSPR